MRIGIARVPGFMRGVGAGALLSLALLCACGDSSAPEDKTPPTESHGAPAEASPAGNMGAAVGSGAMADAGSADAPSAHDASVASSSGSGTDAATQQPVTKPMDSPPPTPTEYEASKKLIGSYAAMIKYRDVLTVGIAGMGSMVTTILATAEIKDDAASKAVRLELNLCQERIGAPTKHLMDLDIAIPNTALTMAHSEPAVLRATSKDGKVTWKADEVHAIAGWKWSSPSDELPTKEDDPRLVDQDGDGKPGVTASYSGHDSGSLYLALVYRFLFSGAVGANGELSGTTMSSSRESLLGITEILLTGTVIERAADPETGDNTIRMIPQASALSCDKLIAVKDTLFL